MNAVENVVELKNAITQRNHSLRNVKEREMCSCIVDVAIILTDRSLLDVFMCGACVLY